MGEKVYLIANNCLLSEHHLESLHIDTDNDIVVLFNYMIVPFEWLKAVRNKIVFLRVVYEEQDEANKHYLGGVEFIERQLEFSKVVCLDDFGRYEDFIKEVEIPCSNLDIEKFLTEINFVYNNGIGIPTSGFVAYLYMKHIYPSKEIVLVGFTGHYADGTTPDKTHHDYDWEQVYYKQNSVKRVYTALDDLIDTTDSYNPILINN